MTGRPLSAWQTQWAAVVAKPQATVLRLDLPRDELSQRIDRRVEEMFAAGFVAEVRRLRALERPWSRQAAQALGYREVCDHLDGKTNLAETVPRVQTRTRQFVKRQLTWFRHLPGCRPVTMELTWALWCPTMRGSQGC